MALEKEISVFNENQARLRADNPSGGFAVIKDDEVLGVWVSRVDALRAGVNKYGNTVFLVRDINKGGIVVNFTRSITFGNASISK